MDGVYRWAEQGLDIVLKPVHTFQLSFPDVQEIGSISTEAPPPDYWSYQPFSMEDAASVVSIKMKQNFNFSFLWMEDQMFSY